jgi:ribosomal-protein-alanine N-acetyltransferase
MKIRRALMLDTQDIVKIAEANFNTPWTTNAIIESTRDNGVYVAVDNVNAIIGYVIIHEGFDTLEIMNIAVDDDYKRSGVGKALLGCVIDCYRNTEKEIWLEVRDNNTPAIALYEKIGFERIGLRKGFYADETPPRDALTMKYKK